MALPAARAASSRSVNDIAANLTAVKVRIDAACTRSGRRTDDVTLVAVSKTWPTEVLARALALGQSDLGENRAQELEQKANVLASTAVRWHFIGHLQSNKVRQVVGRAGLIHSVDRYGLAEAISRRAVGLGLTQDVLIEVNVSGEATKGGVEPGRCRPLALEVAELPGVEVKGLMTMAPLADNPEHSRPYFTELAGLRDALAAELPTATELSMGMTRDFEVAVEEGSTLVRVGEAVFGRRGAA